MGRDKRPSDGALPIIGNIMLFPHSSAKWSFDVEADPDTVEGELTIAAA
jgi:hypothetical protein